MRCGDNIILPALARTRRSAPTGIFSRLADLLRCWRRRADERRQLAAMGSLAWRDLALSDIDIRREVEKPFWRR
ncbi:hypothetical protein [Ferrovibrio sp.]|uniref:DUF1127 domain-containing protein n=1 Tax=Ferrovibrio sp. TaxID=1917215 RepID=UPI00261E2236|nr:hypothetical protein [Ferrovibrio sp.]